MVLSVLATACSFSDEPPLCPYNARLDYWYSGGGDENELLLRVDHLTQYLYDSRGELLRVEELRGDSVLHWRADLPPGDYSVVTWGNLGTGAEASVVEEGPTALKDMTLSAARPDVPPGYRPNTERLYYATKAFTVEAGKVCPGAGVRIPRPRPAEHHGALDGRFPGRGRGLPDADGGNPRQVRIYPGARDRVVQW